MSKGKPTIADWLSIAAILLYVLFTCIGFLFTKQLTMSVVWTLGYTAAVIVMLMILKKLKKAEDNIRLYRAVEYVTLVIVAVLMFFVFNRPMERAFNMMSSAKETLKEKANADLTAYKNIFDTYERTEGDAIESTKISLGRIVGKGKKYISMDLQKYLTSHFNKGEYLKVDEVRRYSEGLEKKYLSINEEGIQKPTWIEGDYMTFKTETLDRIKKINNIIDSWSPFSIPFTVLEYGNRSIPALGREIDNKLTKFSRAHNPDDMPYKFTVMANLSAVYDVDLVMEYSYSLPNSYKEAFLQSLEASSFAIWPFIWSLLIDLFILMSYLLGYRSTKVEIMRGHGSIPGTRL